MLSLAGARLLLNMKEAGAKGLHEGIPSSGLKSNISELDFAAPPMAPDRDSVTSTLR